MTFSENRTVYSGGFVSVVSGAFEVVPNHGHMGPTQCMVIIETKLTVKKLLQPLRYRVKKLPPVHRGPDHPLTKHQLKKSHFSSLKFNCEDL